MATAVFIGRDSIEIFRLWVTGGTVLGTHEVTTSVAFTSADLAPDITVLGGKVLFVRQDTSGHANLWVTDGTEAGTSELAAANANVYCRNDSGEAFVWHSNGTTVTGGGRRLVKREGLPWV